MKTERKNLPKSQIELVIELSHDELQPYLEKAATKIATEKKIEGFRPGKAPFDIVKQQFGEMTIYGEAADMAINKLLWPTIEKEEIEIITQPQIDIVKLAPGNAFVWKAILTTLPKVTKLADYHKIKIKGQPIKIEDGQVDKLLKELQTFRAKETLEDKAIAKGDKVELDYDISVDRVAIENGLAKKIPIIIGEGHILPEFEEKVIGMKSKETKDFQITFPEKHYQKNLAGKTADFKVTIGNVYKRELPELNDEFAKGLGQFTTLEELKDQLKKNLEAEEKIKQGEELENQIFDRLIEGSKFEDLPEALINSEAHKMIHELEHNFESQGLKFSDYLEQLKKTEEQLMLDFAPQAAKRVKSALVIRAIAKAEKIDPTKEEIDAEVERALQYYPTDLPAQEKVRSESYRDYLRGIITNRKVIDLLKKLIVE